MLRMIQNGSTGWFQLRATGSLCAKSARTSAANHTPREGGGCAAADGLRTSHIQCARVLITSPGQLADFAPEWLALCRRTPGTTPFQTPMWILPWWKHFGSDELAVIASPDALAPLYIVRDGDESLGMFLGTGNSDYLDVVGDAAAIIDDLVELDCRMWDLQQLRPLSTML